MSAAVQQRLDATLSRADEVLRERLRREVAELEREKAARADAARARYRADADDCRQIAARYDGGFGAFGTETPQARDGEDPDNFRYRLFRRLLKRLPDDHSLQGVDPSELPPIALDNLEAQLIREAAAEGAAPSEANLPQSGEMISRTRVDDMNGKSVEWFGKESFIKSLSRPGRRVLRICDPRSGNVLFGPSFHR
jgi:hypothetical protein